ncbi:hypothetical protein DES53_1065 [Roseimicrobium gellanilyticum]|uniref:DUF1453 domain-containing protein n=1 Tax=Roseimicrobium gellanilyticum TaxID=748857 RepID=A0A366HHV9_9BACT|nr:DUF1453 domain-containing protein [Roseimicrobium gellanilyticum]RBP42301.1 hypothetical protein DES53_1065 [Roseimicrobium gellanilyticum]
MPLLLLTLALIALLALVALALPLSIISRYRAGTARRRARPWVALLNVISIGISTLLFLGTAVFSSLWVSGAFKYSAVGVVCGMVLGLVGLRLTRWEATSQALHFIPNRWLVLAITVGVFLRLSFGLWRVWKSWHASSGDHSWLAESGLAGSMATGAIVLGYYLTFWFGIWARARAVVGPSKQQG